MAAFPETITLGRSGLVTRPMGIGADQGLGSRALQWAFERGFNYFYWGSRRTEGMRKAILELAPRRREQMVVALQSYDMTGFAMGATFRRGLAQLKLDHADILILGRRDGPLPRRIEDKALALKQSGLVRHLCISAHDRSAYRAHLARGIYDLIMVRYNCAHPGAEDEVFPLVDAEPSPPGVIAYNSTRWGHLFEDAWMPAGVPTPEPTHLYRHALSHPAVNMVLTAPKTQAQLEANVKALEQGPLDEDERAWLARVGAHVHGLSPHGTWDFIAQGRPPKPR